MNTIDLDQLEDVDRVELKWAVADGVLDALLGAVELDALESEIRQVYYFDTSDLTLLRHGVVLRARHLQRGESDLVAKLRPVVPAEVSEKWRATSGFTIEAEVAPGLDMYTAALKCFRRQGHLQETLGGQRTVQALFSKRQRAMLRECGAAKIAWPSLQAHGPVSVLRVRGAAQRLGLRVVVELWRYPDGSSIVEVSTKVPPSDLAEASARLSALHELGFEIADEQETKTERTLTFFALPSSS